MVISSCILASFLALTLARHVGHVFRDWSGFGFAHRIQLPGNFRRAMYSDSVLFLLILSNPGSYSTVLCTSPEVFRKRRFFRTYDTQQLASGERHILSPFSFLIVASLRTYISLFWSYAQLLLRWLLRWRVKHGQYLLRHPAGAMSQVDPYDRRQKLGS